LAVTEAALAGVKVQLLSAVVTAIRALQVHAPSKLIGPLAQLEGIYDEYDTYYYAGDKVMSVGGKETVITSARIGADTASLGGSDAHVAGSVDGLDSYAQTKCSSRAISTWRHHPLVSATASAAATPNIVVAPSGAVGAAAPTSATAPSIFAPSGLAGTNGAPASRAPSAAAAGSATGAAPAAQDPAALLVSRAQVQSCSPHGSPPTQPSR
jgi:hypothetical protein